MSIAARIKEFTLDYLEAYHETDGLSSDPYNEQCQFHPMAEGKFMLALASMRRSASLGSNRHRDFLDAGRERLEGSAIKTGIRKLGFGLDFPYKDVPGDEPYVITTSIVAHGLLENIPLMEQLKHLRRISGKCLRWLQKTEKLQTGSTKPIKVPVFSPRNRKIVFNAVAYWAAVMNMGASAGLAGTGTWAPDTAPWLLENFVPGHGWPYMPEDTRFDLVHQCYILNSLIRFFGARETEDTALETMSKFGFPGGMIDKYDLTSQEEALDAAARSGEVTVHFDPEKAIIFYHKPARIWSRGEALTVMACLAEQGEHKDYWHSTMIRNALTAMDICGADPQGAAETFGLRHTMHLAHGLARVLEVLRLNS